MKVEKRTVARTGDAKLGWYMGHGYIKERLTVRSDVWCVVRGREVIAECRSKKKAELVLGAFNHTCPN